MINTAVGKILKIDYHCVDLVRLVVSIQERICTAYAFPWVCGNLAVGDEVILNTTAVDLGLGSGGFHFVMGNCAIKEMSGATEPDRCAGHIIKLRYTPFQLKVCAVEEEDSPHYQKMKNVQSLEGTPVISGALHSMLVPCVCGLKAVHRGLKVAYVMTDGGALSLALSDAVRDLKKKHLLCGTITVGHAFGGDLEATNLYSGLLAAKEVLQAHVIVALMGPGVVGTNTKWGTTALELGQIINAVQALQGKSYTIPRLSFAESRKRHYGISHHTITAINEVSLAVTNLVLPELKHAQKEYIQKQLSELRAEKCLLSWADGRQGIELARKMGLTLASMGREYIDDPAFFLAASAVGKVTAGEVFF